MPGAGTAVLPRRRDANRDRPRAPTGARTLKAFPISTLGGVSFLRAVSATYPDVRFIPTGGVDASNAARVPCVTERTRMWRQLDYDRADPSRACVRRAHPACTASRGAGGVSVLRLRAADSCRWDLVALGEVMLRLDPGEARIATTRSFRVWEGGGEYNAARGLKRCFGQRSAIVTALAANPVGRLIEDLMYQGGVDRAQLNWRSV